MNGSGWRHFDLSGLVSQQKILLNYCCQTTPGVFAPVLTLGGTSAEEASSLGEGLNWGWGCGSVRAGVDDEEDGDEDGG